jgi:Flp pilus assembly protein TadG
MVEMAMVCMAFLVLLFGIIELGRLWFSYNLLTHATREGARLAAVRPALQQNDQAVANRIRDILAQGGLNPSATTVVYQSPLQTGRIVRVTAEVQFAPVVVLWTAPTVTPLLFPLRVNVITRYEV